MEKPNALRKPQDEILNALDKIKEQANTKERELIEVIYSMYDRVKDVPQKTKENFQKTATAVNDSVHKHPWQYLAAGSSVAFIFGLMSGLLYHRR